MYFDSPSSGNKVFVGGVSGVTFRDIYDGFSCFGPVANVKLIADHETGEPRGFGFVTFMDALSAQHAIQAGCGYSASGIRLTVRPAHSKAQKAVHGTIMLQHQIPLHTPTTFIRRPAQNTSQDAHSVQQSKPAGDSKQQSSFRACAKAFIPRPKATASALMDIIHQAPRLLDVFPQDSLKALSATSRNLRQAVHNLVTVVTVADEADMHCLLKGSWPHLSMIVMQHQEYGYSSFSQLLKPRWQLLARIDLSTRCFGSVDVVLLVKPLEHPHQTTQGVYQIYVRPLRGLLNKVGPGLRRIHLSEINLRGMGPAVLTQLSQGSWPLLTSLDMNDNKLGADSIAELVKGDFPALESLDLSSNKLDVAAMKQLVKGDWPALKYLWLSINPLLNAEGIKQMSNTKWGQLHDLSLSYSPISPDMMQELIKLPLPKLRTLSLSGCGLDVAAVSMLAGAKWPILRSLRLTENRMPAEAVSQLILGHFPALRLLDLSNCKIDTVAMQQLILGDWPLLQDLDLSYNQLDNEAIGYLLRGHWTSLTNLSLNQNTFGVQAVQELTTGDWPVLRFLCLDFQVLNNANAGMLGIHAAKLKEFEDEKARTGSCVVQISRDSSCLWRKLKHVLVI